MQHTVGIDLGTTNSCVAIYQNGQVRIIQNEDGDRVTPSIVTFTHNCVLTGKEAVDTSYRYPKTTIYEAKRLIGQQYNNAKVQRDISMCRYAVTNEHNKPCIQIEYEDRIVEMYYPEEISAFILQMLKKIAEEAVNEDIVRAVVTVPAYFNDVQRHATKNAAYIAGFEVVNVINEPTAAALAFNHISNNNQNKHLLIYDFGGGTFDVSIVVVNGENCKVKATKGDGHLGGTDIDNNLANFVENDIKEKLNVTIDKTEFYRIKTKCEKAKKNLSGKSYTSLIEIEALGIEKKMYSSNITRAKLEQLNEDIFVKTMQIVDDYLKDSNFTAEEIDQVVLVGGSSRIPKVQNLLRAKFGPKKINKQVNPDEAVAFGAAIHAYNLTEGKLVVEDVTSLSLGTSTLGDDMSVIIQRNKTIPTKRFKTYKTIENGQTSMEFPIYQGESDVASENYELGKFTITGLTAAPAGSVQVRVCFNINEDGLIDVYAKEKGSHNSKHVTINVEKCGLSPEQLQRSIKQAIDNNQKLKEQEEFLKHKHELEILVFHVLGIDNARPREEKKDIKKICNEFLERLNDASLEDLKTLMEMKHFIEELGNN